MEAATLALLISAAVYWVRPKLYESLITFTLDAELVAPGSAVAGAAQSPRATAQALLSFALSRADDPAPSDPRVRRGFAVELLRNLQLQLVCRAERPELAEHICGRAGIEALAQLPALQHASPARPATRARIKPRELLWPGLCAGFAWFALRSLLSRRRLQALREAQRDWSPSRARATRSERSAPRVSRARLREWAVGLETLVLKPRAVAVPAAAVGGIPVPTAAQTIAAKRDELPRPGGPGGVPRVLYHVGKGAWTADASVLLPPQLEELRELGAQLAREIEAGCRVVRVASTSASRYAKSQVAAQLASSLAERGDVRVLALEGDLDEPALQRVLQLNVPRGMGLSEQLERMRAADSPSNSATIVRLTGHLHALVEGPLGTPSLLDSPEFADVIARQRIEHDIIVVDGPIIDTWDDARVLKHAADGVVFVVAAGTSLSDAMQLAHAHFANEKILRIVRTGHWPEA